MKTLQKTLFGTLLMFITVSCSKKDDEPAPEIPFAFNENFDDTPINLKSRGWDFIKNNSHDGVFPFWHKGFTDNYTSHEGNPDAYISIDEECVEANPQLTRIINSWLLTPSLKLKNGDVISFYTRTKNDFKADRLKVYLSSTDATVNPTSENNGSFSNLILEINPSLQNTYPVTWTKYSITIQGLTSVSNCKIGFQYFFSNGGRYTIYSNCLGLDTFKITRQ